MRGPLKAALLLAPALASAVVVPEVPGRGNDADESITDLSSAFVRIEVPTQSKSPDDWLYQALGFRIDILPAEEACGYGNVTIDGQTLPQNLDGNVSIGRGAVSTDMEIVIGASWTFHCIKVNGQPDAQLLKFLVELVDGQPVKDLGFGFSMVFKQSIPTEIVRIETDLSIPDEVAANPDPESLQPVGESSDSSHFNIEDEVADLHWMLAQLEELEWLISEKEQMISKHISHRFKESVRDCDSLRCVIRAVVHRARKVASVVYGTVRGHHGRHGKKPKETHGKKPHQGFPDHHHNGTGNHTHGRPPHGAPHHHRPLPICRYPPPPHHGPKHHPPRPPFPHGPFPPPPPPHHPPPFPHDGPPPPPPPPPHQEMRHDDPGHPESHHFPKGPHNPHMRPGRPDFDEEEEHFGFPHGEDHHHDPPPDLFEGPPEGEFPGPPPEFDPHNPIGPHHGRPPHKAVKILKFIAIGFIFAFLVLALHRRWGLSAHEKARQARKEERRRRRREAHKNVITRLLARMSGNESGDEYDDKEEGVSLLANAEDGMSTTMTEEIVQFRNAADVVGDITAAGTQIEMGSVVPPALVADDIGSQVGDGEELPAYDDNDGSEDGSMIADGFRYTPGSSSYTPSHSSTSSISDILGPDTKQ